MKARKRKPRTAPRDGGFVGAFAAARGRATHPHFEPINASAFMREHGAALAKVPNLIGYRDYLASARAAKARRKTTTMAFERNVLAQAKQAAADLETVTGATLRMAQQVNQTAFWSDTLAQTAATLRQTGPASVKALWADVTGTAERRSALASHGVTPELLAAASEAIGKVDASLVLRDGAVAVEARVAGERQPRRLALRAGPKRPRTLSDLLRRSQFDRTVAAILNKDPVYLEVVSQAGIADYDPADLFAMSTVAMRTRMTEHVRKLEDTGLATYQGNDPVTFVLSVFAIAAILGLIGWGILETCELSGVHDWVCGVGALLVLIATSLMVGIFLILVIDGVAVGILGWVGIMLLSRVIDDHFDQIFPDFNPSGVPA